MERSTRYTLLLYLPNGHSAAEVQDAVIAKLAGLPDSLRLSLTWDQGSELNGRPRKTLDMGYVSGAFWCVVSRVKGVATTPRIWPCVLGAGGGSLKGDSEGVVQ